MARLRLAGKNKKPDTKIFCGEERAKRYLTERLRWINRKNCARPTVEFIVLGTKLELVATLHMRLSDVQILYVNRVFGIDAHRRSSRFHEIRQAPDVALFLRSQASVGKGWVTAVLRTSHVKLQEKAI